MSKNANLTQGEYRAIAEYAMSNLTKIQPDIAKAMHCSVTTVARALKKYCPNWREAKKAALPTSEQITELRRLHPEMTQRDLARELGCSPAHIGRNLIDDGTLPPHIRKTYYRDYKAEYARKESILAEEPEPEYYKTLPCLKCGKPHRSTWVGDRYHDRCRKLIDAMPKTYMSEHRVLLPGNVS